jgi:hypothetical protein
VAPLLSTFVVVVWLMASILQQLLAGAQQLLVVVQQVLISQQSASLLRQQTETSQQAGSSFNPNIDNRLFFLGPLSAIKDTKPNNPKIINKFFFNIILYFKSKQHRL